MGESEEMYLGCLAAILKELVGVRKESVVGNAWKES